MHPCPPIAKEMLSALGALAVCCHGRLLICLDAFDINPAIHPLRRVLLRVRIHTFLSPKKKTYSLWLLASQFQLQLPSWLARTTWDVYFQQAQAGWKISLQPTVYFSFDKDLHVILRDGTSSELFRYLSEKGQGIHGCDTSGSSILHVCY